MAQEDAPARDTEEPIGNAQSIIQTIIAPGTPDNKRNSEGDVVVLADGTLLCAWSDFYGGSGDDSGARISAVRSTDGGRTWGERYTIQENVGEQNVMSVSFLRLQTNELLMFYLVKNSRTDLDLYVRRSTDEAHTWDEATLITPEPGYYIMNNARAVQLSTRRILCPVSFTQETWTSHENYRTVMYLSDDAGVTWTRGVGLVSCPKRGAMEPGVVELRDGRVLQIIRTQMGKVWHATSADGGDTWTEAEPWTVVAPEAPSTIARIPGTGNLLIIHNPDVDLSAGHSGRRTPLVAAVSADEGLTWSAPRPIETDLSATYSYVSITFHQSRALLTYYVSQGGLNSLKFKSFPMSLLCN